MDVQVNAKMIDRTANFKVGNNNTLMITPQINESYWLFRVPVSDSQAVVGFPKFGTIGVGFQVEDNWNTNLPYTSPAEEILSHIGHNKGDDNIPDSLCLEAIRAIQDAVAEHKTAA